MCVLLIIPKHLLKQIKFDSLERANLADIFKSYLDNHHIMLLYTLVGISSRASLLEIQRQTFPLTWTSWIQGQRIIPINSAYEMRFTVEHIH